MTANSIRQLASALDRSHTAVARWPDHPAWTFGPQPPWDVEQVREWAAVNLKPNPGEAYSLDGEEAGATPVDPLEGLRRNPLKAAQLRLLIARAEKLGIEKAILSADFIPRSTVEEALVRRVHVVKSAFEALPRQLAAMLVGKTEHAIEVALQDAVAAVLLELSQKLALPAPPSMEA